MHFSYPPHLTFVFVFKIAKPIRRRVIHPLSKLIWGWFIGELCESISVSDLPWCARANHDSIEAGWSSWIFFYSSIQFFYAVAYYLFCTPIACNLSHYRY